VSDDRRENDVRRVVFGKPSYYLGIMRGWRAVGAAAAVSLVSVICIAALLEFLAPDLSYQLKDSAAEWLSGSRGRTFRIATGSTAGSSHRVGIVLNKYLRARSGYELELVGTAAPGNVGAMLDPRQRIDLAIINSSDDDAAREEAVSGLAALELQYFFVIVPSESTVNEVRDLAGAVNPGTREPGQPPTVGERVLEYYGLIAPPSAPAGFSARVSVVRPTRQGNVADFEAGHMTAATRTQSFHSDLIEGIFRNGRYRIVDIRDHEALAQSIPGTRAGFIPPGLYGPERRIPPAPVPTIVVTELLIARAELPGRVVRDILGVIYDPRFARDVQYDMTESAGRSVGGLPLHPAAEIYYHRNDLLTSDRLGRVSFVASGIAALAAAIQFFVRFRRSERVRSRRRLLGSELATLQDLRRRIEGCARSAEARSLVRDADELLANAEQDAAADLLDSSGIQALRSVHQTCWACWRALQHRLDGQQVEPTDRPDYSGFEPAAPQPAPEEGRATR
jgi:TRAP-type uncharacterized transport system substrate-binding protein